jgi:stage II sporulation protein D
MLGALPLLRSIPARAQSEADPSSWSRRPALRVLLGPGDAVPSGAGFFEFNGRSYRGSFARLDDGQVVNLVDLEEYLFSVVSGEMPSHWPAAALEAQAICARTYVLERSDPRRVYDLIPSQLDQVYDGVAGETPSSTAAVGATVGRVLRYGGNFARVAYSSCCGGHTEASADAWGGKPVAYLRGVICTWCSASPNYRWSRLIAFDSFAARFGAQLAALGELQDVRISDRDSSGRVRSFELLGQRGSTTVAGTEFRREIGARVLPSLLVSKLQRDAQDFSVEGAGFGHGVGLCQWGARGMAQDGRRASEILALYFPGAVIDNFDR